MPIRIEVTHSNISLFVELRRRVPRRVIVPAAEKGVEVALPRKIGFLPR